MQFGWPAARRAWSRATRPGLVRHALRASALVAAFALGRMTMAKAPARSLDTPAVRSARQLEAQLDDLEAGLAAGEGWVMHGDDLRRRHERVSVLQCENAKMQLDITARLQDHARRKLARMEQVASARSPRPEGSDGDGPVAVARTK